MAAEGAETFTSLLPWAIASKQVDTMSGTLKSLSTKRIKNIMSYFFAMIENYRNYSDGLYGEMYLFFIYLMYHSVECISFNEFMVILKEYDYQLFIY